MAISNMVEAFRDGLRNLGYEDGHTVHVEWRWAEGHFDRLPILAAELVRLKVDVIVASVPAAVRAAKDVTRTIPIVMILVPDPDEYGFIASLARPGGNITGLAVIKLGPKRLELLKETVPKAARVALLRNPDNPRHAVDSTRIEAVAVALGLRLTIWEARAPDEFGRLFGAMTKNPPVDALFLLSDPMFILHRRELADLARKHRLPTMHEFKEFVEAGGLMAYLPSYTDSYRRAASFVDKILKGARPADLPVEQPTTFELVINLKTAKALGITIPQAVLLRADEVIQ